MYFQSEKKTVSVLTRWLCQKPADLDRHCFLHEKSPDLYLHGFLNKKPSDLDLHGFLTRKYAGAAGSKLNSYILFEYIHMYHCIYVLCIFVSNQRILKDYCKSNSHMSQRQSQDYICFIFLQIH